MTQWLAAHAARFGRDAVELLLLPPGCIVTLMLAGLLGRRRWPRSAVVLMWSATAALLLLCVPVVADWLTRRTGDFAPLQAASAAQAQAIVVLGGTQRGAAEYGGTTVGDATLERLRMGARLARALRLPILVSGGRAEPDDPDTLAQLMQRALNEDYGLSAAWLENDSANTRQNAMRSAAILRAAGIRTVVIVTHYAHMHRAVEDFREAGLNVLAAPVEVPPASYAGVSAALWPRVRSLEASTLALHELLALAGRRLGLKT